MKKVLLSAALVAAMGVAGLANEGRDEVKGVAKASIQSTARSTVYNLMYRSGQAGLVKVTITNADGNVVMVDDIKTEGGFLRPYNFVGLSEGNYTLTVTDRNGKVELPLEYRGAVAPVQSNIVVKPLDENKYELKVLGSSDAVQVNIYDAANSLIYTDQIAQKGSFSRVYNLNKLNASNYTFEVVGANGVVRKQF